MAYCLGWDEIKTKKTKQTQLLVRLSNEEQKIVDLLQVSALRIDEMSIRSEIPQSKLAMHLLNLEMQEILISLPGKIYKMSG